MIPISPSLSSSESQAYGDTRSDTRGTATANIGLVNAVIGRGNRLDAVASAAGGLPPWVWVAVAAVVVGVAAFLLMRKQ